MPIRITNGLNCDVADNVLYKSPFVLQQYKVASFQTNLIVDGQVNVEQVENLRQSSPNTLVAPNEPLVILLPNKYENGRANLAIFNFTKAGQVDVKAEGALSDGDSFRLMRPQDLFGKPAFTGQVEDGKFTVDMNGEEFATYVVFRGEKIPQLPK